MRVRGWVRGGVLPETTNQSAMQRRDSSQRYRRPHLLGHLDTIGAYRPTGAHVRESCMPIMDRRLGSSRCARWRNRPASFPVQVPSLE